MPPEPQSYLAVDRMTWRGDAVSADSRTIPEETPIALTYGRATHAVMMATPSHLDDFALGFSLSEEIVRRPADIEKLDVVVTGEGIELRMDLVSERQAVLTRRQRRITGPGGCGLCGMDSLAEALRPVPRLSSDASFTPSEIREAHETMPPAQVLNILTRAVHAAAFWTRFDGLVALREDVGRHNALDKLIGALSRSGRIASDGILLLSSRVSVEMVQKAAILGVPVIAAVSAPTALAVRTAEAAGITLIGVARSDSFEVFTHPHRITTGSIRHVA